MTTLEELSRIKRRRLQEENLAIILVILIPVLFFPGYVLNDYFYYLIGFIAYTSIVGGVVLWLGYFRTLRCPNCLNELKYQKDYSNLSASRFHCGNCGFFESLIPELPDMHPQHLIMKYGKIVFLQFPPPSSQAIKNVPPIFYRENGKIVGICIVCNLSITEFEEQLKCPSCFSLAHQTHLLEWAKIKGYCPHCNFSLKFHSEMQYC
ncbi:MAG: hypothetical protein HWN65_15080 [Candidatus Helarchaeota archaeon]|nr:hypothetical protein [Candidatus Helarchaeota archaeon]